MPYQWPVDVEELFAARHPQMVNTGLPSNDVDAVRSAITEMWRDERGGWVHEWSTLAARYVAEGQHDRAALAYGWARFPAITDEAKRTALALQIEQYLLAAPSMPVEFERRVLEIPYQESTTPTPVHILAAPGLPEDAPVLLASGGADTWKVDLHDMFVSMALETGARVIAFDIPGTGESQVTMTPESTEIIDGLVTAARRLGDGRVFHFGISMGGYFSAYSGLAGMVDGSVNFGGPVVATFAPGKPWAEGSIGIIGNMLGFDHDVDLAELGVALEPLSLRPLLDKDENSPMFVVNGENDALVPLHDTTVFEGRRDTQVVIIPGTGHCATSKLDEATQLINDWLRHQLHHSEGRPS
jgi:esterase FrsA